MNEFLVIIIGDIMVDKWEYYSTTGRDENGAPILTLNKREVNLGGAGNVMMNVYGLGYNALLCGVVNSYNDIDVRGKCITSGIRVDNSRVTTVKKRVFINDTQVYRMDEENTHNISSIYENQIIDVITDFTNSRKCKLIIISDYHKGVVTDNIKLFIDKLLHDGKIKHCVINCKKNYLDYLQGCSSNGYSMIVSRNDLPQEFNYTDIYKNNNIDNLLITCGGSGMILFINNNRYDIMGIPVKVKCSIGAGDTVTAVFGLMLANGYNPFISASIANRAGSIVVQKDRISYITRKELF